MFPISDSVKSGKFPLITLAIIILNLFVFYTQITTAGTSEDLFLLRYSLIPAAIDYFNLQTLTPFITSMFLHGGFFHIASNMWFLWVFGDNAEAGLGKVKFLIIYLLSGIIGNLAQVFVAPTSNIPILGASGAVSGILGAYLVIYPRSRIKTLLFFFVIFTIAEIPAAIYIFYWFAVQLFSGIASLPIAFQTGGVAFWAHTGGFLAGLILTRRFKNEIKNRNIIEGEIIE